MMMAEVYDFAGEDLKRPRWALTQAAFEELLQAFDVDPEQASEKYILMGRNLVRFFEGRGCPEACDHADEVLNRVAKRLSEGETIGDLNAYCYGIARLVLLEIYKERERAERAFKELPSLRLVEANAEAVDEERRRLECLNQCLQKLPRDGRQLILGYYEGDHRSRIENRKRLGEKLGLPNQALRSRAVRLREKLEACLSGCLKKKRK
jgi:DNA-directed RNA polymerase specialized sigma24 family protein